MSLELLTKQSDSQQEAAKTGKKVSRTMPAWFIPLVILVGFVTVFAIVLWDDLKPATNVQTARAIAIAEQSTDQAHSPNAPQASAVLLFQAAGWLEPEPLPIKVGALINGTVDKISVNEGQLVKKGEQIASLVDDEFQIAVKQTHAAHMEAQATVHLREAEIKTAQANLKTQEASLAATKERLKRAEISYGRYSKINPGSVSEQAVTDARQEFKELEQVALAEDAKIVAAKTTLEEAKAKYDSAIAFEQSADQACDKAQLDLARCSITSPIDGRILRLTSSPGARVNASADDPESGIIATLYDPESIALKMDVPIDQAGKLSVGQQARIRCEVFPDRVFLGKVTRIAGEADIQRNTLQARVRLDKPDDMLRPGMACRAEIYTPGVLPSGDREPVAAGQPASGQTVLIPASAIVSGDGAPFVWVVSVGDKLEKREVARNAAKDKDGLAAIDKGVLPGEPVVISPGTGLKEGMSVRSTH